MSRIELICNDEDDDIWDYRSQTQRTKKIQNDVKSKRSAAEELHSRKLPSKSKSSGKPKSSLSQKQVKSEDGDFLTINKSQKQKKATQKKKTKVKVEVKTEKTPNAKQDVDRSGRCPVCQMPFAILSMIETPSWHVDQCLDVPYSSKNECAAGLECKSECASHYKKFRHTHLARSRRKIEVANRDTGDVDSARTKLSFDSRSNDKSLVVPGSSADCVIILDSSQDSSYSQRSTFDALDEDLPSPKDETDGDKVCFAKISFAEIGQKQKVTSSNTTKTNLFNRNQNRIESQKKSCKETILDKNKNVLKEDRECELGNDNFELDSDEETQPNPDDHGDNNTEKFMNSNRVNADISNDLTRVETIDLSDDSCGSVQDIDDLVDETRSLSDMINDALAQDDVSATESSEVDSDKVDYNQKYDLRKRLTPSTYKDDNSEVESYTAVNEDNDTDDEEDDLISLFTGRTEEKSVNRMTRESAISGLRETPAKSTDSSSSSDWEILRTTLTQPSFEQDGVRKDMDAKAVLEDISHFHKASLRTPTKASERAFGRQDEKKKSTVEINNIASAEKDSTPQRGFFATKMLQNFDKNKSVKSNINSFSSGLDNADNTEEGIPNEYKQLKDRSTQGTHLTKTCNDEEICLKNKHSQIKRKSPAKTEKVKNAADRFISAHSPLGKRKCPSESTKLKRNCTPIKEEVGETETVEKKPKIELKPKTPIKRKLGKKGQKQMSAKKENKDSIYPKLDTFFKSKGKIKSEEISIHTDSESSGDCERFNKIGKFVKCCANCTKEKSCMSNYTSTMNDRIQISNRGDNNSKVLNTDKGKCDNVTSITFKPSQDTCDNISDSVPFSEAASCSGCMSSQNSLNFTVSGSSWKTLSKDGNHCVSRECSQKSQGHSCSGQSQGNTCSLRPPGCCCSQHSQCSGIQKRNSHSNSFHSSCSQNSLQVNIQNVCTLSQNTFSNMGGGFIIENKDNGQVSSLHCANHVNSQRTCTSSTDQNIENTCVSVSDKEVESILQIRKSATDILMASSRLLYGKSAKSNSAAVRVQKLDNVSMTNRGNTNLGSSTVRTDFPLTSKRPAENANQRSRGWNRNQGSTSTETSSDTNDRRRKCPFYKKIPDTGMTVDAFRYGNIPDCRAYILSHFHYDHYMGLNKHFKNPIYCSKVTGNLVKKKIGVDYQYIHTLPLYTPTVVENVEITFLEANHCPGAVLILFKLKSGKVYLHTGDFRASRAMELYPPLQNLRVHALYLDTTYCDPQYDFPPQEEVIQYTVKLALDALTNNPKTLIVCGTYTIGKERIFTAIAEELDCKICVTRDKKAVLDCMEDEKLRQRVSLQWEDSCLHVVPMNKINYSGLQEHLLLNGKKYNSVLGIEPTGWTHNKKILSLHHIRPKVNKDNIKIYGVPYSEHSSFLELKRFVQFTKPAKVLPTVNNGNVHSRRRMEVIFEAWIEDPNVDRGPVTTQSSITGWTK